MSVTNVLKMLKEVDAKFVDLRLTDLRGQEQHVTLPASQVDKQLFTDGKMFDGSSLSGWKDINESDMILLPDPSTAVVDPFYHEVTVNLRCSVIEPTTMKGYVRGPRSTAKRAEEYLRATGIGDAAYFGPENEFFLFDSVRWDNQMGAAFYEVQSAEAAWSSADDDEGGNSGHRPGVKGGYFPTPPVDSGQDIRSEMCLMLEAMGVQTEVHHHEVATGGQAEIGTRFGTMVRKADDVQIFKYVVKNVAHEHGLTATFMPKPLEGDNGSGMHVHQSIFKGDKNLFSGDLYGGLSQEALYYIGGIFKHARALNAFTNASTNSYKRLVPGFEAPTILAYSARNRSASCRIPYVANPKARRVEIRFPDSTSNPYFAFTALLMAGLDGVRNKIDPGPARDENLYALSAAESAKIPTVASSLEDALAALDRDREFLLQGDVMSNDLIDAYIALKTEEVDRLRMAPHPCEFDMYYSA